MEARTKRSFHPSSSTTGEGAAVAVEACVLLEAGPRKAARKQGRHLTPINGRNAELLPYRRRGASQPTACTAANTVNSAAAVLSEVQRKVISCTLGFVLFRPDSWWKQRSAHINAIPGMTRCCRSRNAREYPRNDESCEQYHIISCRKCNNTILILSRLGYHVI